MPNVGPIEVGLTIGWIVVVVLLLYALVVGLARIARRLVPASSSPRDPALDELRTRLASGEIDEREYQRLRSILQGH